jgi:thiol-disulfide isomerase/thioredoxin
MWFRHRLLLLATLTLLPLAASALTEKELREGLGFAPNTRLLYRDADCRPVSLAQFGKLMASEDAHAKAAHKPSGGEVTLTLSVKGTAACASPYGPLQQLPPLDYKDLANKQITATMLRGKPTLVSYFFARCVPCVKEVPLLNAFQARHPEMNTLAITFDEPRDAQDFVARYGFQWRVIPKAQNFIDRSGISRYPTLALFDAEGRVLGMKMGGAVTEKEVAAYGPVLENWVQGLLKPPK